MWVCVSSKSQLLNWSKLQSSLHIHFWNISLFTNINFNPDFIFIFRTFLLHRPKSEEKEKYLNNQSDMFVQSSNSHFSVWVDQEQSPHLFTFLLLNLVRFLFYFKNREKTRPNRPNRPTRQRTTKPIQKPHGTHHLLTHWPLTQTHQTKPGGLCKCEYRIVPLEKERVT